jgi:hypothetical protein
MVVVTVVVMVVVTVVVIVVLTVVLLLPVRITKSFSLAFQVLR